MISLVRILFYRTEHVHNLRYNKRHFFFVLDRIERYFNIYQVYNRFILLSVPLLQRFTHSVCPAYHYHGEGK